jgi:death-on-curing protein
MARYVSGELPALAASCAFGIERAPFVGGNKRTAYVVCRTFLLLNGHGLEAPAVDKHVTFLRLAQESPDEEDLADGLRRSLRKTRRT